MGQAGRPTSHYLLYPALSWLGLFCLSFRVQCRGNNVQAFESIQRAMRRDQSRAPEPMRSTLPNTDQPRIPHSEYHHKTHPNDLKFGYLQAFRGRILTLCNEEEEHTQNTFLVSVILQIYMYSSIFKNPLHTFSIYFLCMKNLYKKYTI